MGGGWEVLGESWGEMGKIYLPPLPTIPEHSRTPHVPFLHN